MNTESCRTQDQKFTKLMKLQLPPYMKRIGLVLAIIGFVGLFVNAFSIDSKLLREIVKHLMIVGLLVVSISKEEVEDEMIIKMRMQSYSIAFIYAVFLTLLTPGVDYVVDLILSKPDPGMHEFNYFTVIWQLLSVQVFVFYLLKRDQ